MKTKKAGILTKVIVTVLLVYFAVALIDLRTQIKTAETDLANYQQQVDAQTQANAALSAALDNKDDPAVKEEIAREKLGLVGSGEKIFYDITN